MSRCLLTAVVLLCACFESSVPNCAITCSDDDDCPNGYQCDVDRCVDSQTLDENNGATVCGPDMPPPDDADAGSPRPLTGFAWEAPSVPSDQDGDGYMFFEDCNDHDANVFPGQTEYCNDVDDDCDGEVDEEGALESREFYPDVDGDGQGDENAVPVLACNPPEGFVANNIDCYDDNANARIGQSAYFSQHRGDGKFDYNCNDEADLEISALGYCVNNYSTCTNDLGWDGTVPACGQQGQLIVACDGQCFESATTPAICVCLKDTSTTTLRCR